MLIVEKGNAFMIKSGIIVSIQGYSQETTQELAIHAVDGGAVAIRTDHEIKVSVPVIGLKKNNQKYYITTNRTDLIAVSKWSDYVAIDSRKGNPDLELLYSHCHLSCIPIVADVETIEDVKNIIVMCNERNIIKPNYFATTFNFNLSQLEKKNNIEKIQDITDIPIIAEGGYTNETGILLAKLSKVNNICIGTAISDIKKNTQRFMTYFQKYKDIK